MSEELLPKAQDHDESEKDDRPSLRQRLHAATGDRDAEAKALADETDDEVSVEDAKVAVQLARGERSAAAPELEHEIATPADAEAVKEIRDDGSARR
jgi:hypothetical protein